MVVICREYLLGISIELSRRALVQSDPSQVARSLELAALFTHAQMQPPHASLALRSAMTLFSKAGNYGQAAAFARRLLELQPGPKVAAQVRFVASLNRNKKEDQILIRISSVPLASSLVSEIGSANPDRIRTKPKGRNQCGLRPSRAQPPDLRRFPQPYFPRRTKRLGPVHGSKVQARV